MLYTVIQCLLLFLSTVTQLAFCSEDISSSSSSTTLSDYGDESIQARQTSEHTTTRSLATENPDLLPVVTVDEEDIQNTNSSSLTPTIVDDESAQPSGTPTITPSPTITSTPTSSFSPSHSPTMTYGPSSSPTTSPRPSTSPAPTSTPSKSPTMVPTISPRPSISHQPTISARPTGAPSISHRPSPVPSETPTLGPTMSVRPSFSPTLSHSPTVSLVPSSMPSQTPVLPTIGPTLPIIDTGTVTQDKITMVLYNVPAPLGIDDGLLWENITENHILRFFAETHAQAPGLLNFNVSAAYDTIISRQTFTIFPTAPSSTTTMTTSPASTGEDDSSDPSSSSSVSTSPPTSQTPPLGRLELEYSQTIDYVLFVPVETTNEDVIRHRVFTLPFENDAGSYILDMVEAFGYDTWIELQDLNAGPTMAPTVSPPVVEEDDDDKSFGNGFTGLSPTAVRSISASVVLAAILIVAVLFWDRHRRENMYKENHHARDLLETMEHDNAGNAGDWKNPFGSMSQADEAPPPPSNPVATASMSAAAAAVGGSGMGDGGGGGITAASVKVGSSSFDRRPTLTVMENKPRPSRDPIDSTVMAGTPSDIEGLQSAPRTPSMGGSARDGGIEIDIDAHNRNDDIPGRSQHPSSATSLGGGSGPILHGIFLTPPTHPRLDGRHVSVANTEVTDLTYSETGDRASDGGAEMFNLPPISDEGYYMIHHDNDDNPMPYENRHLVDDDVQEPQEQLDDGIVPWSSFHIPQADPYATIGNDQIPLRPDLDAAALAHPTGFEIHVQELE